MTVPFTATIADFRKQVAIKTSTNEANLVAEEVHCSKYWKHFVDTDEVDKILETDKIFVYVTKQYDCQLKK